VELRRLLVASGDLDFIEQISSGLNGRGFSVYPAYSHNDAVYHLRNDTFALAIVDSRLTQRESSEPSISVLQKIYPRPPIVVYANGDRQFAHSAEIQLNALDEVTLRTTLMRALRIPKIEPLEGANGNSELVLARAQPPPDDELPTSIYWRDDQIKTLFSLSRSLTEVLDLSEVLNRVVEAARRLTNAEEGMILLPDEHSEELYLRARVGMDAQVAENFRIRTQDTLAGTVFTSGQSVLVSAQGPQKIKTEYFVNALLYVPIVLNDIPLGVLGVNNRQKRDAFTERHRELLLNLASYAAIAINNARTHGESLRRGQELKLLVDASQAVNASLSFDKTMVAICESLARVLNVHIASLYDIVAEDDPTLALRATFKQARWRGGTEELIPLSEYLSEAMVRMGSFNVDTTTSDAVSLLRRAGAQRALLLPVLHGDTLFGALIAYQVGAIKADLPRSRLQRAQRALSDNAQILIGGTSDRTTSTAFQTLGDLRAVLDADSIELAVISPDARSLKVRYSYGGMAWISANAAAHHDQPIPFTGDYTFNVSIEDTTRAEIADALLDRWGGCAVLALPIKVRGQIQGLAILIDTLRPRTFLKREIDLARALLGQAGTAMDNAHLVVDLEDSLRELRAAQEKLVQSARLSAMGELAAAVAHQINNPLTTIVLDTELLLDGAAAGSHTHESLSAILRAGKRASGVVRRLLSSARPGSENAPPVPVDVIHSIQETIALIFPYFERAAIRLTVVVPSEPIPLVMAPPGALDDVWLNLLLNAHDILVGRAGSRVDVIIQHTPDSAYIDVTIRDNGPGIPDAIRAHIFEPFFTTKPDGEGTGLGLYICRQVIARVGGDLIVNSDDSGAAFVVQLPI